MGDSFSIDEIMKMAEDARKRSETTKAKSIDFATGGSRSDSVRQNDEKDDTKSADNQKATIDNDKEKTKHIDLNSANGKTKNTDLKHRFRGDTKKIDATQNVSIDKTMVVESPGTKEYSKKTVDNNVKPTVTDSDKTAVVRGLDNSKTSFFRREKPVEKVYSDEPPQIIEKPATIKSKSKFDKTSDLEEVPTILAVEELENSRVMGNTADFDLNARKKKEYDDGAVQIKLMGFDDETDEVSQIDERNAEQLLQERREEKIKKFRPSIHDERNHKVSAQPIVKSDYRNAEEKTTITERLFSQKANIQISLSLTIILGICQLLMTMFQDTKYLPSFLLSVTAYHITLIILFVLIMLVNINTFVHAFSFKHGFNSDLPVAIVAIITLAHLIATLAVPDLRLEGSGVYSSVVTLSFFFSNLGKRSLLVRTIENFEFLTNGREKYTVEEIQNEVEATIIGRGLLKEKPILKTSIKTDFPTNYLEIGCACDPSDKISKKNMIAMSILNIALFGVLYYTTKNIYLAINVVACSFVISLPAVSLFATNTAVTELSRKLRQNGAIVNGYEGAEVVNNADAIIVEAQDLFGSQNCQMHGLKTFNSAKIDDVILKTAAVITKTKSPLSHVFDDIIVGKQSILPEVEKVVYEDRLGSSGWIYQKKILVGSRELLVHHGVSVPKESFEEKYTQDGRKALYLSVAGQIMAMFIVSYSVDDKLKKELQKLEKSGMTLLVKSSDPYITEESLTQMFDLPEGYIRVMNSSSGRTYDKYSDMHVEKSPAYVVHNGSSLGFISAMRAAESLMETRDILSVLISFGAAIGFGVVMLLSLLDGFDQLTPINVLIFQAAWSLFVCVITKLKKLDI